MFMASLLVIATVPLSANNADVLETLIIVAISGNALEHIGGAISAKLGTGRPSSGGGPAGDPVRKG